MVRLDAGARRVSHRRPGRIVTTAMDAASVARARAIVAELGHNGATRALGISPLQLDGILYGDFFLPRTVEKLAAKIQEVSCGRRI